MLFVDRSQPVQPAQPARPATAEKNIDSLLSRSSKRRLIQIAFELLGSPTELNDEGDNQWEGANGAINSPVANRRMEENPQEVSVVT